MIRLLGADIDARVAEELGLPKYLVMHKRQRLAIPPHGDVPEQRSERAFNWTKGKIALLGTDSDRKIAERLGTIGPVVARQRTRLGIPSFYRYRRISWTKRMVSLLGKTTDWEIAERYGIMRESAARERRKRGIPPCVDTRPVSHSYTAADSVAADANDRPSLPDIHRDRSKTTPRARYSPAGALAGQASKNEARDDLIPLAMKNQG